MVELYGLDDRNGVSIRMGYSHIKGVSFHIYLESSLVTYLGHGRRLTSRDLQEWDDKNGVSIGME